MVDPLVLQLQAPSSSYIHKADQEMYKNNLVKPDFGSTLIVAFWCAILSPHILIFDARKGTRNRESSIKKGNTRSHPTTKRSGGGSLGQHNNNKWNNGWCDKSLWNSDTPTPRRGMNDRDTTMWPHRKLIWPSFRWLDLLCYVHRETRACWHGHKSACLPVFLTCLS